MPRIAQIGDFQPHSDYFTQPSNDLLLCAEISHGGFRLFCLLLSYCREPGKFECWPSQPTLAGQLKVTERTIRNWLSELEQAGFITITSRQADQDSNIYQLHNHRLTAPPKETDFRTLRKSTPPPKETDFRTLRKNFSYETHESKHMNHVCESAPQNPPLMELEPVAKRHNPNPNSRGYVPLLKAAGLGDKAAGELAAIAAGNARDEAYIKRWIEVAATKNNPAGYLVKVITSNGEPPSESGAKVARLASGRRTSGDSRYPCKNAGCNGFRREFAAHYCEDCLKKGVRTNVVISES